MMFINCEAVKSDLSMKSEFFPLEIVGDLEAEKTSLSLRAAF